MDKALNIRCLYLFRLFVVHVFCVCVCVADVNDPTGFKTHFDQMLRRIQRHRHASRYCLSFIEMQLCCKSMRCIFAQVLNDLVLVLASKHLLHSSHFHIYFRFSGKWNISRNGKKCGLPSNDLKWIFLP